MILPLMQVVLTIYQHHYPMTGLLLPLSHQHHVHQYPSIVKVHRLLMGDIHQYTVPGAEDNRSPSHHRLDSLSYHSHHCPAEVEVVVLLAR